MLALEETKDWKWQIANQISTFARGASEEDLVISGLEETMITAYQEIRAVRQHLGGQADLRTTAFISSIDKIAHCYKDLGIFP